MIARQVGYPGGNRGRVKRTGCEIAVGGEGCSVADRNIAHGAGYRRCPCARVKVVAVDRVRAIASLKVAVINWLRGTSVAPFRGIVEITVGGVTSGAAPVVNVHTKLAAMAVPDRFVTPVVTVAV